MRGYDQEHCAVNGVPLPDDSDDSLIAATASPSALALQQPQPLKLMPDAHFLLPPLTPQPSVDTQRAAQVRRDGCKLVFLFSVCSVLIVVDGRSVPHLSSGQRQALLPRMCKHLPGLPLCLSVSVCVRVSRFVVNMVMTCRTLVAARRSVIAVLETVASRVCLAASACAAFSVPATGKPYDRAVNVALLL